MELPKRKQNRLTDYDYSQPGCYFITICTKEKAHLFGRIDYGAVNGVGADIIRLYERDTDDCWANETRGSETGRM